MRGFQGHLRVRPPAIGSWGHRTLGFFAMDFTCPAQSQDGKCTKQTLTANWHSEVPVHAGGCQGGQTRRTNSPSGCGNLCIVVTPFSWSYVLVRCASLLLHFLKVFLTTSEALGKLRSRGGWVKQGGIWAPNRPWTGADLSECYKDTRAHWNPICKQLWSFYAHVWFRQWRSVETGVY